MVLVYDKPGNAIGILQTKLRDREGHEARRVGLETVPLDQHIEGGHGERQACLKIRPASMHHLVWLKYCVASSSLSKIVAEQSTEAFSPYHATRLTTHCSLRRDKPVVETLMIAF